MKIELTIKTTYLPEWGAFEGVRELLQNAKDAESEFQAPMDVRYMADRQQLVIENLGCQLPHEALLFGHTTKAGRGDLIGKFGEGLKLGVLALVRAGHQVKIRSGSEVWTPQIERSEKFDADVLVFHIEKHRQPKDRVQVIIHGITSEDWAALRPNFLFLAKKKTDQINTHFGSLLLDKEMAGKVFVKGIFVQHSSLMYGYNLVRDVEIDRDRKMINNSDMSWRIRNIWQEAMTRREDLTQSFVNMLQEDALDVSGFDSNYTAEGLPQTVKDLVLNTFHAKYGPDAVPVNTLGDSKDMEHLGRRGVITNKPLSIVLQNMLGTPDTIKIKLSEEVLQTFGWSDLTKTERDNLSESIALVNGVEPIDLDQVDVVQFRSSALFGMFRDGRMFLSKAYLEDPQVTLETLVHEVAHRYGSDGDHKHVAAIERIWSGIVRSLRNP